MMKKSVSVVIPSRDRPENLLRAVESVLSTAPEAGVVCVVDIDDKPTMELVGTLQEKTGGHVMLCLTNPSHGYTSAERWNLGAEFAVNMQNAPNYFALGADDVVFEPGWLEAAFQAMDILGGSGLVGFNEGGPAWGKLATHFLVSRKYAARGLGGVMMPPMYGHGYPDVEVTMRARADGKLAFAEGARIKHLHPFHGTAEMDSIYEKGDSTHDADEALFQERILKGFPNDYPPVLSYKIDDNSWGNVAIGLRTYKTVSSMFMPSWSRFLLTGVRRGDVLLGIEKQLGRSQPHAANIIALEFLKSECDSLLMVDDDMILPFDGLSLMRDNRENWDYDVVQGFCTHRTYPPHAVANVLAPEQPGLPKSLSGLLYNALAHLPENGVEKVDAVGMAFTLIKRHVIEEMLSEYGPEWTVWFDFGGHSEMEDMRFSKRCREHGFSLAVDTHAKIGHIGEHTYGWPEHQKFISLLGETNG